MSKSFKVVLFVNDSYFSYLLAKSFIQEYNNLIQLIVFSKSTIDSKRKIFGIFKKVSKKYFFYRVFVQILSKYFFKRKSISHLAEKYNINSCIITSSRELNEIVNINRFDCGLVFNFDLIIKKEIIKNIRFGIYNIHASKLPKDKGISPVLWAFARGDNEIWSTIYKIDDGIDSGPIAMQFRIEINKNDTAFSLYKRTCLISGIELSRLFDKIQNDEIELINQSSEINESYNTWPSKKFEYMLENSGRKLIKISNVFE